VRFDDGLERRMGMGCYGRGKRRFRLVHVP
jgi:hypothetical protein